MKYIYEGEIIDFEPEARLISIEKDGKIEYQEPAPYLIDMCRFIIITTHYYSEKDLSTLFEYRDYENAYATFFKKQRSKKLIYKIKKPFEIMKEEVTDRMIFIEIDSVCRMDFDLIIENRVHAVISKDTYGDFISFMVYTDISNLTEEEKNAKMIYKFYNDKLTVRRVQKAEYVMPELPNSDESEESFFC